MVGDADQNAEVGGICARSQCHSSELLCHRSGGMTDIRATLPGAGRLSPLASAIGRHPAAGSTVRFIDLDFTAIDARQVMRSIEERSPAAPFVYVVTPNVDHLVRLQRSRSDLWPAYRGAWLTLCDSRILARLAGWLGLALPVVAGSDLTARMFGQVVHPEDRVAILGGRSDVIATLARRHRLEDVHHYDPPMGFIEDPAQVAKAVRFLLDAGARYSFLAIGSPQQEILAHKVARAGGGVGIGFCVGASLDFLTGAQERAPEFMQRLSLEWLHRLCSNPRRMWRRYLVDGPRIFRIAREWKHERAVR